MRDMNLQAEEVSYSKVLLKHDACVPSLRMYPDAYCTCSGPHGWMTYTDPKAQQVVLR